MDLIKKAIRNIQVANDELVPAPEAVVVAKEIRKVEDAFYIGVVGADQVAALSECARKVLDGLVGARNAGSKISVKFVRSMEAIIEELSSAVVDPVEVACVNFVASGIEGLLPVDGTAVDTVDRARTYLRSVNSSLSKYISFVGVPSVARDLSSLLFDDIEGAATNHQTVLPEFFARVEQLAQGYRTQGFSVARDDWAEDTEDSDDEDLDSLSLSKIEALN